MEVLVYPDADAVAEAAADTLALLARSRTGKRLKPRVALSGGSTPKAMYEVLRQQGGATGEALRHVRYFFGDERAVPNNHPESNVKLALDGFLRELVVPDTQLHLPNGGAAVLSAEAWRLTLMLDRVLPKKKGTDIPQFDLIFLGMGTDGHTASLFPGTDALAADDYGYVMNEVPQLKTRRLTLTFPLINAAKHAVILATGENKAGLIEEIFSRVPGDPKNYPVESVDSERVTWMLDRSAGARLPRELLRAARPA
jgi:6-phosphogluconolactonase